MDGIRFRDQTGRGDSLSGDFDLWLSQPASETLPHLVLEPNPRETPQRLEKPSLLADGYRELKEKGRRSVVEKEDGQAAADLVARRVTLGVGDCIPWPAEEAGNAEQLLRRFDLEPKYGPCCGVSRSERWERAQRLGIDPPPAGLKALEVSREERSILDQRQWSSPTPGRHSRML